MLRLKIFMKIAFIGIMAILFNSCEKDKVDYGPAFFELKIDGSSNSLDRISATYSGSLGVNAGDYVDDPYRVFLFLADEIDGVGTYNASTINTSTPAITIWKTDGPMYWDYRTIESTKITITKYDKGSVVEGRFSGKVYDADNESDVLQVSGSFRAK